MIFNSMVKYVPLSRTNRVNSSRSRIPDVIVTFCSLLTYSLILYFNKYLPLGEKNVKNETETFSDGAISCFVTFAVLSISRGREYFLLPGLVAASVALFSLGFVESFRVSITPSSLPNWKPEVAATMAGLFAIELLCIVYYVLGNDSKILKLYVLLVPILFIISSIICLATPTCTFHLHHASLAMSMLWISQLRKSIVASFLRGFYLGVFLHAIASFNAAGVVTAMFRPF